MQNIPTTLLHSPALLPRGSKCSKKVVDSEANQKKKKEIEQEHI